MEIVKITHGMVVVEARRQSGGKKLSVKDLLASIPVDPITSDSLLPKGFAGAKRPKPKKPPSEIS